MKVDPGWRVDWAARLIWLARPRMRFFEFAGTTDVIARMAPVPGWIETIAAAGSSRYGRIVRMARVAARWRRGTIVV